jgi:beta-N-acetylglucosaminidase.
MPGRSCLENAGWLLLLMKLCAGFLLMAQVVLGCSAPAAAQIPLRGVVEGFYGKPWTQEERLSQLGFYGEQGLNAYIYAPKDDPWHRAKWREPYPEEKLRELSTLIDAAGKSGVEFIFAVSPGLDLHLDGVAGEEDRRALQRKLEALYRLGVRRFAVFFDDIENSDGRGQAAFLNWLNAQFVHRYDGVKPLITVPKEYFLEDMVRQGTVKPYTADFAATLDKDILVLYTGLTVVPEGLSARDMQAAARFYGRRMGVWWNYPVSDYLKEKLALGPVHGLDGSADMAAFFMNPMEHAELSRLALATGADYANDPAKYDEEASWRRALHNQYGDQTNNMALFAAHSQRMENSWAHTGRQDAPAMRQRMDRLWRKLAAHENAAGELSGLKNDFADLEQAAKELLKALPMEKLQECAPQLRLLATTAAADRTAAAMLEAQTNNEPQCAREFYRLLLKQRAVLGKMENQARISEKTARAFVDEAILWYEKEQARR